MIPSNSKWSLGAVFGGPARHGPQGRRDRRLRVWVDGGVVRQHGASIAAARLTFSGRPGRFSGPRASLPQRVGHFGWQPYPEPYCVLISPAY